MAELALASAAAGARLVEVAIRVGGGVPADDLGGSAPARKQPRAFGQAKANTLPAYCRDCDVRFACHGGCPKDRFRTTPDGEPGLNYLCPSFKRFFAHVAEPMDQMARLLARGRAPSDIVNR